MAVTLDPRPFDFWVVGGLERFSALSKKEALALHRVFCTCVARAWLVRASWSGGSPVLWQKWGIVLSSEIWPRPSRFGGL